VPKESGGTLLDRAVGVFVNVQKRSLGALLEGAVVLSADAGPDVRVPPGVASQ
jgi:hypothetical protein